MLERFRREAQAASALNHPGICTIYEIGEHEAEPFIAMEYLDGVTLKHLISSPYAGFGTHRHHCHRHCGRARCRPCRRHRPSRHQAGEFVRNQTRPRQNPGLWIGESFFAIQPRRIVASPHGEDPTISVNEADLTSPGTALGTVAYMSPEQVRAKELDARTDIFSFGAVLYEMVTGTMPFRGESSGVIFNAILERQPIPAVRLNPDIPEELERILRKCLEKDREIALPACLGDPL